MDAPARRKALRAAARAARAAFPGDERAVASSMICAHIISSDEFVRAQTIGTYLAMPFETNLGAVIDAAHAARKRIVVPRIVSDGVLEMVELTTSDLAALVPDRFGIATPMSSEVVDPVDIDLVLVPLVAFDDSNHRIGNGKGYYDRYLRRIEDAAHEMGRQPPPFIGAAFEVQRVEPFEPADWDVALDFVVTEFRAGPAGGATEAMPRPPAE